jgi:hypothetical protein
MHPVPLPSFSDLLNLVNNRKTDHTNWKIEKYVKSPWFCSGAESLLNICNQLSKDTKDVYLMLPAYFCGQSLRYLRGASVNFIFYNLCDDLTPNYDHIEQLLCDKQPDIFLHVHYFGCVSSQRDSRELCDKHNMVMVEDCAHVMHPSVHGMWLGDYIFFSPHKYFPVDHAGIVFSKKELTINTLYREESFPFLWYLKRLVKRHILSNVKIKGCDWSVKWSSQSNLSKFLTPNSIEIDLLKIKSINIHDLSNKRMKNKDMLLNTLRLFDKWELMSNFGENNVPYVLGMRCESEAIASNLFLKFRSCKCPVMMWPDLPFELKVLSRNYKSDVDRVKVNIFFFLHEQIEMNKYLKLIKKVLNEK